MSELRLGRVAPGGDALAVARHDDCLRDVITYCYRGRRATRDRGLETGDRGLGEREGFNVQLQVPHPSL